MPLYSIVTGDFQDPVLGRMRFKVESLQLKVKPGNRAEREEGTQLRGRRRRVSVGRFRGIGRPTLHEPERGAPPRVELSVPVHWCSCSLRSECSPTRNSKGKPGHPA